MSRTCVICLGCMGIPLNSHIYWPWSTEKCHWEALEWVKTRMLLGKSKYLALLRCSPRNCTFTQKSNLLWPRSSNVRFFILMPGKWGLFHCFTYFFYSSTVQCSWTLFREGLWNNRNNLIQLQWKHFEFFGITQLWNILLSIFIYHKFEPNSKDPSYGVTQ